MNTPTPPASLPWEWAARELALAPASAVDTIRRACEQWARSATEHWRQHDAQMHTALAAGESQRETLRAQLDLCRAILEEARPMIKARLITQDVTGYCPDESILTRIDEALKGGAA